MKKIFVALLAAALILMLCGNCDNTPSSFSAILHDSSNDFLASSDFLEFPIGRESISVMCPGFEREGSDCTEINALLTATLYDYFTKLYGEDLNNQTIHVEYDIKFLNNYLSSIVFYGMSHAQSAAHPTNIMFSVNLLMKELQIVRFSDIIVINDEFVQKFVGCWKEQNPKEIAEYIDDFSMDELTELLKGDDVYCYFSNNKIGVIMEVPHAIGDAISATIPLQQISSNLKAFPAKV